MGTPIANRVRSILGAASSGEGISPEDSQWWQSFISDPAQQDAFEKENGFRYGQKQGDLGYDNGDNGSWISKNLFRPVTNNMVPLMAAYMTAGASGALGSGVAGEAAGTAAGGAGSGMTGYFAGATPEGLLAANAGNATMGAGGLGSMAALGGDTAATLSPAAASAFTSSMGGTGSTSSGGGLLDWAANNKGLVGAGLGALAGTQSQTQSSNRDPWGPAQQYLRDNLATNARMQDYYQANPFSDQQKQAYQHQANVLANNNANMPNFNQMASNFMNSRGGKLAPMPGLLSDTKAPEIDWTKYQNIGRY